MMKLLDELALSADGREAFEAVKNAPVTVLQIGEGNFLRGFADWMLHTCRSQGLFKGSVAVTQPRPAGKTKIDKLAQQNGIYTLVTQGLENGEPVMRKEIISIFSQAFDPYSEWRRLIALAVSPDLRIVISNTTEAGLVYRPEPLTDGPIPSYPGKVAFLLHERYQAFRGDPSKGLILLPCELLPRNGDALKEAVLRYAEDWSFSAAFQEWVNDHNRFLNSLVDRIVTGYPDEAQAEALFEEWGYRDAMLVTAEPYHLWAIEAEPEMEELLPFRKAGLHVHWTDDLTPFQQRKVRILNGAHTWMAPVGLLHGVQHVRELLEHPVLGAMAKDTVQREILPALPYEEDELQAYARSVFDRFGNPYIRHRLADIAMNSLSKFKARLLPSITFYLEVGKRVPAGLMLSLAALLRYYRITPDEDGSFQGRDLNGNSYVVRDDAAILEKIAGHWEGGTDVHSAVKALLADEELWGQDLSGRNGMGDAVTEQIRRLERGEFHA